MARPRATTSGVRSDTGGAVFLTRADPGKHPRTFHGNLDGETHPGHTAWMTTAEDEAFLVGVLIGEGSFGGDGRAPQVTLRMHIRHQQLFEWIVEHFPGGKLYGPYNHGGREYYQWMARGPYLRDVLVPVLDRWLSQRYVKMKATYRIP